MYTLIIISIKIVHEVHTKRWQTWHE